MEHIPMCINGEWIEGEDKITVYNPSTGKPLVTIANATYAQIDDAVRIANEAFEGEEWRNVKPFERGQLLVEFAQFIRQNAEHFAKLESLDVGKPLQQARADVEAAARYFEFYGGAADKVMGDTIPIEDGIFNAVVLEPIGVTVHIVPWNYPIQITSRSVAAAIATGNAVIVKSAEDTPLTTHEIVKWLNARLPKGIIQHVTGFGKDVGAYLSSHPGIHQITFTGSVPTGIAVMQAAAKNIVPVTLELGGKSPNVVFADANEELALEGVMRAIIQNAGQTCSAGARLLIEKSYKEIFCAKLVERFQQIRIGAGEQNLDMGPVLNANQLKKITTLLELAQRDGKVLIGGKPLRVENYENGYYVEPTIVDGLDVTHPLAVEEIFGPILTVFTFETVEEAIQLANSTDYGLVAGVWTRDIDVAHFMASRIKAGQVFINNYGAAGGIQMPFGGYKKSGIGREKGLVAMRNYTQMKNIAIRYNVQGR
ncbi:aldehyde dehydrogenase family protein [Solibacillus sp. FSL K6-1126]|uniref:aldehyde dehydrogenase family protein n=1 Tax=Solibacillus sp. FSL K6-1126 TaxID=2921463 RepID=UPI0030F9FF25